MLCLFFHPSDASRPSSARLVPAIRPSATIRSLPVELQKDIGWPDAFDTDSGYRRGVGSWAGTK